MIKLVNRGALAILNYTVVKILKMIILSITIHIMKEPKQ